MPELNWLELAGVCGIGTIVLLFIFFIIEVGKEVLSKSLEPEDKNKEKE